METKTKFWTILGIILLIIVLAMVLFALTSNNNEQDTSTQVTIDTSTFTTSLDGLSIRDFYLVDSYTPSPIGLDYYDVRDNNEYYMNESVNVYYVIEKIKTFEGNKEVNEQNGNRMVTLSNKVKLIGPNGEEYWFGIGESFELNDEEINGNGSGEDNVMQLPNYITIPANTLKQSGFYLLEVEVANSHYQEIYKDDISFMIREQNN